MAPSVLGRLVGWLAYQLFRSPFARRSKWIHTKTMALFRWSSERGDAKSLATYGFLLHFRGSDHASKEQGGLYIQAAADLGDARSQYQMGILFEKGHTPLFIKNGPKAFEYYLRAANQSHPLAIEKVAAVYRLGELGVTADPKAADLWQTKSSLDVS